MTKIGLLSCLFLSASLCASELTTIKSYDKPFELLQSDRGYSLKSDTFAMHFPAHQVSKPIRDLRADQLATLLKSNAYYFKATQLSDGTHALDLQGRMNGGAWGGATLGACIGYIVIPTLIVVPSVVGMYAVKAAIHVTAGPVIAGEFGNRMEQDLIPKVVDFAVNVGNVAAPVGAVIGGISGPL